ncbi:SAM-dependent methyltransferase [Desulfuromonas versatilis]|uniref:SAM-dependent methyltransferase n=1 Tax=Desulfuromonas versatilis TaxID=2802975 RepID=A0ABN6E2Y8_9BACT|nr:class I SAM-dependent rRNA methyltransferase [Desulfuromonas versatilis]BCR05899.1 SAM-dependent methyltransferase [Desulfuromonas versatilis]
MANKRCVVGPETVRMLELGHPWVIADRHTRTWPPGKAGDLVDLVDEKGSLLATALLDPGDRVVARVLGPGGQSLDREWLRRRLELALNVRREHADLSETNAYRVVNGEGDGLPGLTLERYGDYLMVQLYTAAWNPHLPLVTSVLQQLLAPRGIYEKFRPQQTRGLAAEKAGKRYSRLLAGEAAPARVEVQENGLSYLVDLKEGLNTGLFLDQRRNRQDLARRVKGKRVLNLFAFTGAFSVTAAAAGAERVVSVDASAGYLDWAKENFGINRLNPKRHDFIVGDCFKVLEEMVRNRESFDVVLMDPPSFSTTTKSRFTTRGGTSDLVAAALALLPSGGLMITSSNHQKVELADYLKELRRGALQAGSELRVLRVLGQAEDFPFPVSFPEGRYLKYVIAARA